MAGVGIRVAADGVEVVGDDDADVRGDRVHAGRQVEQVGDGPAEPRRHPGDVAAVGTGWWDGHAHRGCTVRAVTAAWHDQVMSSLGPRVVVAGTHSGVGKTTVATGLLAALRPAGHRVRGGQGRARLHRPRLPRPRHRAAGRATSTPGCAAPTPSRPLAGRAAAGADVLVVEGVMGLFDGAADGTPSSTADVPACSTRRWCWWSTPAAMAGSVAAVVHGFATLDPTVRVGRRDPQPGRLATATRLLREALGRSACRSLGALRRDDRLTWRDRHLGLVPVAEQPERVAAHARARWPPRWPPGATSTPWCALARAAPTAAPSASVPLPAPGRRTVRVAVAAGPAFTFTYPDNVEALEAAGAEIVPFDPLATPPCPTAVDGLVVGGGFPEVYAEALAANAPLLPTCARGSATGCRRGPSAAACCGWPARSTAARWPG